MKMITLSGKRGFGKYALVDDKDFDLLNHYKWHYERCGYAVRSVYYGKSDGKRNQKKIFMHDVILNTKGVDHKNGNKLDNRKANLRKATAAQNQWNVPLTKRNTSGYKGITWNKKLKKWQVYIGVENQNMYVGVYSDIGMAILARRSMESIYHGEFSSSRRLSL